MRSVPERDSFTELTLNLSSGSQNFEAGRISDFQAQGEERPLAQYCNVSTVNDSDNDLILIASNRYRFELPRPTDILGLPIGQHISLAATIDGQEKEVVRSYTPISSDEDHGFFDLLIKSYPTGNISRHVAGLEIGDVMKVKGPRGAMVYTPNMNRHIGMIAGGTGITPMLQVIRAIQRNRPNDQTEVDLLFANVNPEDILLKDDLDRIAKEDSKIRVHYVLNNPPEGWTGGMGFVTPEMIKVSNSFLALFF